MSHPVLNAGPSDRKWPVALTKLALASVLVTAIAGASTAPTEVKKTATPARAGCDDEAVRRSTAVTLNYCRASFYRIQRFPSLRVLVEEQEKILNNLDLNGIADQEVVKLYTGVLVEISELRMADRERHVLNEKYRTGLGTALTGDAFDFGTQVASGQYLSAIRTGARSWWDYRNSSTVLDTDVFHADQKRLMAFTEKSGQFLDTFWKLARDRKIPDRWLIRNQDLSKLDAAMQERDLPVRLRVLKRMQDFMACYPPYWYYLARTEQALGHLSKAASTYDKLCSVGQGHFRKDDMLAAGLANEAVIQDYLHRDCAPQTALKALGYSTDVWEANLMCAHVLGKNGRVAEAEDAVLRNLDVDLERVQSTAALLSLYARQGKIAQLRARLANPGIVRTLPMPLVIRAAAALGPRRTPEAVVAQWASSVAAHYELNYGPDDFVLVTTPLWGLQASEMSLVIRDDSYRNSTIALAPGQSEVRFPRIGEVGHPLYASSSPPSALLIVKFPDTPLVRLRLDSRPETGLAAQTRATFPMVDLLTSASAKGRQQKLSLVSIQIGETEFPVEARLTGERTIPSDADVDPATAPADVDSPSPAGPAASPSSTASPSASPVVAPAQTTAPPVTSSVPAQSAGTGELPVPRLTPAKLPASLTLDGPKLFP